MAKLSILTQDAYDRLRDCLDQPNGVAAYSSPNACNLVSTADLQEIPLCTLRGTLTLQSTTAAGIHPATTDAANAEAVYSHIGEIKPIYAADSRVWAALTHGECWAYAQWRYPIPADPEKVKEHIRSHWFVSGDGLAGLRRNAVARLWWAAALTVAPWERDDALTRYRKADRFYYTNVLLAAQQVYQDVMERDFGSNTRLRIAFLDSLDRARGKVTSLGDLVQTAAVQMTLLLEFKHLPALDIDEIQVSCDDVVQWAVDLVNAA